MRSPLFIFIGILSVAVPGAISAGVPDASPGLRKEAIERRESGLQEHYTKDLTLSDKAQQDQKELGDLNPHGIGLPFHGKDQKQADGSIAVVPDIASAGTSLQQFHLDDESIRLFAALAAAEDNLRQAEHEWDHPVWLVEDTPEGRQKQQELLGKKRAKYKVVMENELGIAATAYRQLKNHLDKKTLHNIRDALFSQAVDLETKNGKAREAARQRAIASCQQGLQTCTFPEGLAENCAGYLGMTVKELKAKCPVMKRSDAK